MSIFTKPLSQLGTADVQELLGEAAVENARLEFKLAVPNKDETLKKLSSFANTFGGFMVIGAKANSTDGRIEDLPAVAEAYSRMLDDLMGRTRATLTFAQAPSDGDLARVLGGLEGIAHKQIIPTVQVDPALIGGVIAELEGKTYDGSLARRLAEAARRLAS